MSIPSVAIVRLLAAGVLPEAVAVPGWHRGLCQLAHWSRELKGLGHTVRLMPPAYVKPYVKRQKNDAADAEAICEALPGPTCGLSRPRRLCSRAAASDQLDEWPSRTPGRCRRHRKAGTSQVDDIAVHAAKAGGKSVGVVIDDAAVTPKYLTGLPAAREIPIVAKIAGGYCGANRPS